MLNAEWGAMSIASTAQERIPGGSIRSYAGRRIDMEIINTGTARWIANNKTTDGSVAIRISQPGQPDEWITPVPLNRGERTTVAWTPREPGLWEAQAYLSGFGKFGEALRLEITTPPGLF